MNLKAQIDSIKLDAGKSRKDKGAKVKLAATRFEEHFRSRIFTTVEFIEWMKTEPELARYLNNPSAARQALQQAGTRTDLPKPFEIVRVGKSDWALHPPENYFLKGRYPKEITEFLQKTNRKVRKLLQGIDWDHLSQLERLSFTTQYRYYKHGQEHMMLTMSEMQMALDNMNEGFLELSPTSTQLENGTHDSDQTQP